MSVVTNAVRRIWRAALVVTIPTRSGRWEAVWIGLLALAQLTDVVTTQVDLAQGNVEANPQAAAILHVGGIGLLWLFKFLLVGAIALIMLLARRALRLADAAAHPSLLVRLPHFVALRGTQASVLVLTMISLNNALMLPLHPL